VKQALDRIAAWPTMAKTLDRQRYQSVYDCYGIVISRRAAAAMIRRLMLQRTRNIDILLRCT